MRKTATVIAACFAGMVASSLTAVAQTSFVSEFKNWGVYRNSQLPGNQCFALSVPTSTQPASVSHGDNFVMVSRTGQRFSPQLVFGYPISAAKPVIMTIDGKPFRFFSQGNRAWAEQEAEESAIVAAMRLGHSIQVDATSERGTKTRYNFSLSGLTAALNRLSQCK